MACKTRVKIDVSQPLMIWPQLSFWSHILPLSSKYFLFCCVKRWPVFSLFFLWKVFPHLWRFAKFFLFLFNLSLSWRFSGCRRQITQQLTCVLGFSIDTCHILLLSIYLNACFIVIICVNVYTYLYVSFASWRHKIGHILSTSLCQHTDWQ